MIKQISYVRNFGVFRDFTWNHAIPEFKKHNILYGWNYSGKTTISRVFQCFGMGSMHPDYPDAEFGLIDDQGSLHDSSDLNSIPNIRVFNVDFIERNLHWFGGQGDIEPILILGEKNAKIQAELAVTQRELVDLKSEKERLAGRTREDRKQHEDALAAGAKRIGETLRVRPFDKRHLREAIDGMRPRYDDHVLQQEDFDSRMRAHQVAVPKSEISIMGKPNLQLGELLQSARRLMDTKIDVKEVIKYLEEDPEANAWVKEGRKLHRSRTTCLFCGSKLPADLLERLNRHFSTEYEGVEREIEKLSQRLERHSGELRRYSESLPSVDSFCAAVTVRYSQLRKRIIEEATQYIAALDAVAASLKGKQRSMFRPLAMDPVPDNSEDLLSHMDSANALIHEHNEEARGFTEQRQRIERELILHFAARFAQEHNYDMMVAGIAKTEEEVERLAASILASENSIREMELQISDLSIGAQRISQHVKQMMMLSDIDLRVAESGKFHVMRAGLPARNLSEGEKTAISLAYFLASLEEKGAELEKTIVFVDDPVSSLDCNHLFNAYSLISSKLCKCHQLFVSTHNIEFFNLLKDCLKFDLKYGNGSACFLVRLEKTKHQTNATITDLPGVLRRHKTEYNYLFGLLREFQQSPNLGADEEGRLYLMPNVMRRFLEGYLSLRFPDGGKPLLKIDRLIADEAERCCAAKIMDEYSHNLSVDNALRFPDYEECKKAVNILLKNLEGADKAHYDALCESCK